jgi:threonine dehydrogenase-like Zn-dependent dehydrogenase
MQMDARAFWVAAPGRGEIRDETLGPLGDDDVLVRTLYSGISRGTESIVFHGRVPESQRHTMRAPFQVGDFPGPVKYGYACVGVVERGPAALVDATVFALHPHQTRFILPADAVHPVPDEVPPARAVLAANLETAINGLWDARPHVGDRIAIVGGGTVGCLAAWLAAGVPGCAVELVDINPARMRVADRLGARGVLPSTATKGADLVIHASGAPAGLALALELAGDEARIVELSWFGDQTVSLPLGGDFHSRRLTIASSQVGSVPASQRLRWNIRRRMQLALSLLADPALDVLISGESRFDVLPQVMPTLTASPGDTLCHRIIYP